MSTYVQGLQSLFRVSLHNFVLAKIVTSSIRVNIQSSQKQPDNFDEQKYENSRRYS